MSNFRFTIRGNLKTNQIVFPSDLCKFNLFRDFLRLSQASDSTLSQSSHSRSNTGKRKETYKSKTTGSMKMYSDPSDTYIIKVGGQSVEGTILLSYHRNDITIYTLLFNFQ